ncbi:MAG: FKBP-type peptidyl-prolyl cis-trans isomerase [Bacteroidota bacterium]
MKQFALLFFILILYTHSACKKTSNQVAVDESIITKYISDNHLNASATGSGLYYVSDLKGTGATPNINSNVTVKYTGYLTNGTVFDQTTNIGASFNLNGVIKGWQEGIPLFNRGGKGKLLIPSALGYGSQANGRIPANSVLIFDIDVLDVR